MEFLLNFFSSAFGPMVLITAIGLSMDAFAAALVLGSQSFVWRRVFFGAFLFGFAQGGMTFLGYCLGLPFGAWMDRVDHWVAFLILSFLGGRMFWESLQKTDSQNEPSTWSLQQLFSLAFATSIDAFVVGIGLHALDWELLPSVFVIGFVTFLVCVLGFILGGWIRARWALWAERLGALALMGLGIRVLVEHLFG